MTNCAILQIESQKLITKKEATNEDSLSNLIIFSIYCLINFPWKFPFSFANLTM